MNKQCVPAFNPSNDRKRQTSSATVEMYFESLGAVLPITPSLRGNLRNWDHDPYEDSLGLSAMSGVSTVKTELSGTQGATLSLQLLSNLTLEIPSRDPDLDPFVVQVTLFYPNRTVPTAPFLTEISDNSVSVIGPIVSIKDSATEIVLINATHVVGINFYDPPAPFQDAIAAVQGGSVAPMRNDTHLMYRNAILQLSYIPGYTVGLIIDPASDITIFGLILGEPLPQIGFTGNASGGIFEAKLSLSQGIYAGSWNGGAIFALGLTNDFSISPGMPTSTSTSLSPVSQPSSLSSSSMFPSSTSIQGLTESLSLTSSQAAQSSSSIDTLSALSSQSIQPSSAPESSSISLTQSTQSSSSSFNQITQSPSLTDASINPIIKPVVKPVQSLVKHLFDHIKSIFKHIVGPAKSILKHIRNIKPISELVVKPFESIIKHLINSVKSIFRHIFFIRPVKSISKHIRNTKPVIAPFKSAF
ncbi:hypothetical protein BGZ57DRAFT_936584 [Hyaloscypha finlandica]|nr:hypothetical protein BGZ57DRAFT_936584 [Hyaloscypha finlandica]